MKIFGYLLVWVFLISLVGIPTLYVLHSIDMCDVFVANPACRRL